MPKPNPGKSAAISFGRAFVKRKRRGPGRFFDWWFTRRESPSPSQATHVGRSFSRSASGQGLPTAQRKGPSSKKIKPKHRRPLHETACGPAPSYFPMAACLTTPKGVPTCCKPSFGFLPSSLNPAIPVPRSTFASLKALWTKQVSLGPRCVGWPAHEVGALNAARIAGKSDVEIRALVTKLEAARNQAGQGPQA